MAAEVSLEELLETQPDLAAALPGLARAAASEAPLLLLGPAGSGRSLLARAIHRASGRAAGPVVEVDAGSIPTSLFEGELFGHRRGAFTGADADRAGRVERAQGGTLLLDHVEELPITVQPKLLRLLAERRFAPLGGREQPADVRFVAIGSEDLPRRAERGAFRQDLFYRLDVLTCRIPPLRRRRRDLPALIDTLLADLAERFARPGLTVTAQARRWMQEHPWPGEVRQLRNLLERTLVAADGAVLDPEPPAGSAEERPRSLVEVEREQILRALAYTRGHQGRAAEILGISRKALWEKRRRLGIP